MSEPNISISKLNDRLMDTIDTAISHAESCRVGAPNENAETIYKQIYYTLCSTHTLIQVAQDLCRDDDTKSVSEYFDGDDDDDDDDDGVTP